MYGIAAAGFFDFYLCNLSFGVAFTQKILRCGNISFRKAQRSANDHKKESKMINKYEENESGPQIKKGGLYSAFPIPAYQVLGKAKEYQAQKVLLCLVSHLGKGSNCVYPSYTTIARSCGMSRN